MKDTNRAVLSVSRDPMHVESAHVQHMPRKHVERALGDTVVVSCPTQLDCVNGAFGDNQRMPTDRDMLKSVVHWLKMVGHPFFERMLLLRQVFDRFKETEEYRGGAVQDAEIELRSRGAKGDIGDDEPESVIEYANETSTIETMHRLCQIVLLYSTFESLCFGTLGGHGSWRIDDSLIRCAKKRAKADRQNFVLTLLDEAQRRSTKYLVWPNCQPNIEAFVTLRGHLVHNGLDVTDPLRTKLRLLLPEIKEFPGSTPQQKLEALGQVGFLVQIPRSFVSTLFDLLEDLAGALIPPVGSDPPDINESLYPGRPGR